MRQLVRYTDKFLSHSQKNARKERSHDLPQVDRFHPPFTVTLIGYPIGFFVQQEMLRPIHSRLACPPSRLEPFMAAAV